MSAQDEDEATTRMDLAKVQEEMMRVQLPPAEQTPLVTVMGPRAPDAPLPVPPRSRGTKIGVGLFLLGVLVGAVGASGVLLRRGAPAVDAGLQISAPTFAANLPRLSAAFATSTPTPTAPTTIEAARPASASATTTGESKIADNAAPLGAESVGKSDKAEPLEAAEPEPKPGSLPISSSLAPTCQQLLGEPPVKHQSMKAAKRETLVAQHQLLLGNVAMAQAAYCNAFALDHLNVDRHVNLARLYLVRRDWKKAAELGKSGLKLDPDNRAAMGALGDAWAALNKSDDARKMMLAAEGKPHATPAELTLMVKRNLALASRVARLNDFLLAERLYRRVLLIDPRQADAMSGVARCLLKLGDFDAAEAWARRAKHLKSGR
jgi:Flp pilus assembly protein TadD